MDLFYIFTTIQSENDQTQNDTLGRQWNLFLLSTPPRPSAVAVWPCIPGHLTSNRTVCYQGDQTGCGTTAFGVNPPYGLISNCGQCQMLYYLFVFDCVSSLAKLPCSKPGLRSKQERITPSVDWSMLGNAPGGGLSQYWTKFHTPLNFKADCSTFVFLHSISAW